MIDFGRPPQWNCPIPESDASVANSDVNDNYESSTLAPAIDQARISTETTAKTRVSILFLNRQLPAYVPCRFILVFIHLFIKSKTKVFGFYQVSKSYGKLVHNYNQVSQIYRRTYQIKLIFHKS